MIKKLHIHIIIPLIFIGISSCKKKGSSASNDPGLSSSTSSMVYQDLGTVELPMSISTAKRPQQVDFTSLNIGTVTQAFYYRTEQRIDLDVRDNVAVLSPADFVDSQIELFIVSDNGQSYKVLTSRFSHFTRAISLLPDIETISSPRFGSYPNNPVHAPTVVVADGGYLYVAAWRSIYKVNIATGVSELFLGANGQPGTVDGERNQARVNLSDGMLKFGDYIYFTDPSDHILRRVGVNSNENSFDQVETVAGTIGVSGSADGIGTAATFTNPRGLCSDGVSIFIADSGTRLLRRFNPSNGQVDTVVSSGFPSGVNGCAVHLPNHIYVAAGTTIKRIALAGFANTDFFNTSLAPGVEIGGDASTSKFVGLQGLKIEGDDLYFWSRGVHAVYKINVNTEVMSLVSGKPLVPGGKSGDALTVARHCEPSGFEIVGQDMFIVNRRSESVDRLDTLSGNVSRFLGRKTGALSSYCTDGARISNGGGIFLDGDKIYFTQRNEHLLREFDLNTKEVTTLAGETGIAGTSVGAMTQFDSPRAVSSNGTHIFVADKNNHRVLSIEKASRVSTVLAGSGTQGSSNGIGAAASFSNPYGICRLGSKLYVADTANFAIREIDIATQNVITVAGQITVSGFTDNVTATSANFRTIESIYCDESNNRVLISDRGNHAIRVFVPGGAVTTLTGFSGSAGTSNGTLALASFTSPDGITMSGNEIYVTSSTESSVRVISEINDTVDTFVSGSINNKPTHRSNFRADNKLITASNSHLFLNPSFAIVQVELSSGDTQFIVGRDVNMTTVPLQGIKDGAAFHPENARISAFTSDGDFVYTAERSGLINKRDFDGNIIEVVGGTLLEFGTTNDRIVWVNDMVHHEGYLYFSEAANHVIRRLNLENNQISVVAGAVGVSGSINGVGGLARFDSPESIALRGEKLLVADKGNFLVREISLATSDFGTVSTIAGQVGVQAEALGNLAANSLNGVNCLASSGQWVYVCQNDSILKLNYQTKVLSSGWGVEGVVDEFSVGSREDTRFSNLRDISVHEDSMVVLDEGKTYIIDLDSEQSFWFQIVETGDLQPFSYSESEYLHNFKFERSEYVNGKGWLFGKQLNLVLVK